MTPPGVSPHDVEMTPSQRADLERADAVAYLGAGFQPEIERVVAELGDEATAVDLLGGIELVPVTAPLPGVRGEVDGEVLAGAQVDDAGRARVDTPPVLDVVTSRSE